MTIKTYVTTKQNAGIKETMNDVYGKLCGTCQMSNISSSQVMHGRWLVIHDIIYGAHLIIGLLRPLAIHLEDHGNHLMDSV
jgi:hypothetical protein